MQHVYREAQATIVLDRHLQNLRGQCTPEQIAQTIITSNWRTRLWTLQEVCDSLRAASWCTDVLLGLLAQQLILRLGDGFVSSRTLFASYLQTLQERDQAFRFGTP